MMLKLIVTASMLFLLISCQQHPYNNLILGRWKILQRSNGWEWPNPITFEFSKRQYIITDTIKRESATYNYTIEDNNIILKTGIPKKVDTLIIVRFNKDTMVINPAHLRGDSMYFIKY